MDRTNFRLNTEIERFIDDYDGTAMLCGVVHITVSGTRCA